MLRSFLTGLIAVTVLASCERHEPEVGTAPPAAESLVAAPARPLPPVLSQVEGMTEAIHDTIDAGRWKSASHMAASLYEVRHQLREVEAPVSDIDRFEIHVRELQSALLDENELEAHFAANRASRTTMLMMQAYASPLPSTIGLMRVDARDVLYLSRCADWANAREAAHALDDRYAEISGHVQGEDPALDARIQRDLNMLVAAVDAQDGARIEPLVRRVLEETARVRSTYDM